MSKKDFLIGAAVGTAAGAALTCALGALAAYAGGLASKCHLCCWDGDDGSGDIGKESEDFADGPTEDDFVEEFEAVK